MPDVKRQKTSARGSKHRNVRAGSPTFRLVAAIRRRLLAFGSFLERSGERAIRLSLFRAGEFLKRPLPRRIHVHPTLAARTSGIAVAAIAHKVTPALEERGILRSLRRRRRSLDSRLRKLRREPERAMPAVIAGLLSVAIIASLLPGPTVDARTQALDDGGMSVGMGAAYEPTFTTVWGGTENPDRLASDGIAESTAVSDGVLIGETATESTFSMRATEVVVQAPDSVVATTAIDGPIFLDDGTLELPAAIDIVVADGRDHVLIHVVARGETLAAIAKRYKISSMELIWSNGLQSADNPAVGKRLRVPDTRGIVVTVRENETLKSIASKYRVTPTTIRTYNKLKVVDLVLGMVLVLPGGRGAALPTFTRGDGLIGYTGPLPAAYSGVKFRYPVPGGRYVRGFTRTHLGMDISNAYGASIVAAGDGVVVFSGWRNNCGGYQVIIAHGSNLYTGYYHLSGIVASTGQKVTRGTRIGRMGQTGCATGPHLHFVVSRGFPLAGASTLYNPARFLP
ncbi:MAG: M23 family metallopeptidase [Chloroflexi bacterium]|nr:M23 family metallopeptidase [Chloroflexota bacterium]